MSIVTFSESLNWTDKTKFTTRNYHRRPNCWSAINLAKLNFTKSEMPSNELKQFIYLNQCLKPQTLYQVADFTIINSNFIYYDSNLNAESKIKELKKFSHISPYPGLVVSAILIGEQNKDLVDESLKAVFSKLEKPIKVESNPILGGVVLNYCIKTYNDPCLEFLGNKKQATK